METKPYNLQSPEQIAKDYAGNKQKIAEAMQMGILDPTAGTLAAMFIDRMRQAAQAEAVPEQSVAQQVFAPPAPQAPMGLGAALPMNATPPMDAVPAGLGATPEAAMMAAPEAAPMGMAAGGMVPPYMGNTGLSSLPLPDDMFDENRNGGFNDGYRGGGLVAFSGGTDEDGVKEDTPPSRVGPNGEILVDAQKEKPKVPPKVTKYPTTPDFVVPQKIYGMKGGPLENLDVVNEAAPRETKYAKQIQEYYEKLRDPEEQKKQRKQDFWMSMGQLGAKMASTPGSILQAFSAGAAEAIPGMREAAKAQRAEELGAYQALVAEERTANKELETRLGVALDMSKAYATAADAMKNRAFQDLLTRLGFDVDLATAKVSAGASLAGALASAGASRYGSQLGLRGDILRNNSAARAEAIKDISPGGTYYQDYLKRGDAAYKDRYKFYGGLDTSGWSASQE